MEKLYTIKEVADILRVSKVTLYRVMKEDKIKTVKLGRKTLFKETEINRFIDNLKGHNKE